MATAEGSSQVTYDHIFKIILIGDNGVGKSSFIRRFCEGSYVADMETTIGVDFYLSEIDVSGKKIKVSPASLVPRLSLCARNDCEWFQRFKGHLSK